MIDHAYFDSSFRACADKNTAAEGLDPPCNDPYDGTYLCVALGPETLLAVRFNEKLCHIFRSLDA